MKLDRERARDLSFYREREGELQLGAIIQREREEIGDTFFLQEIDPSKKSTY